MEGQSIGRTTVPPGSLSRTSEVRNGSGTDMKMWPTPRTGGGSRPNQKGGKVLNEEVLIAEGLRERGKTLAQQQTESMWPTPTTKGFGHASEGQTMIMRRKVESGELTEKEAQAMLNGTTLRPPRLKEWMWPTPRASGQENPESLIKRKGARAAAQHNLTAAVKDDANSNEEGLQGFRQSRNQLNKRFSLRSEGSEGEHGTVGQGWWSVEPNVGRVAHGVPGRVYRLKGLGNSIVPQIVEEIGYALIKAERE